MYAYEVAWIILNEVVFYWKNCLILYYFFLYLKSEDLLYSYLNRNLTLIY